MAKKKEQDKRVDELDRLKIKRQFTLVHNGRKMYFAPGESYQVSDSAPLQEPGKFVSPEVAQILLESNVAR